MSIPRTANSEATTEIDMCDLESGKKMVTSITVDSIDSPERPVLGRRKTTNDALNAASLNEHKLEYEGEQDTLTKIGNFVWRIHSASIIARYALYILPVAALLAIPLVLTATVYHTAQAGNIRLLGLFIWIEILWVGLWICKLLAKAMPIIYQAACGIISSGIRKYAVVLTALEVPISLLLWTILAYASKPVITRFKLDPTKAVADWHNTLAKVFLAGICVAAIFLAEKTLIQLVSINYHHKQYNSKIREAKKLVGLLDLLYDASRNLFPEFCREFEEIDADIQGNTLSDVRTHLSKAGGRAVGKVINNMGRMRDKATAAFGAMASDISGKQVFSTTSAHSVIVEALETERASKALAKRLWLSFVGEGRSELYKHDLIEVLGSQRCEEVNEIFSTLDRDSNGDVSLEEMTMLLVSVGQERKNRATSMHDISQAIAVLDKLLSVVVLVAIAFIYATFFSPTFSEKTTQLWTTFTGLAFAIGGTVTEFLSCCIFLFVKHPYDVGDRVDITQVELVVEHISLMYTVFRRIDSEKTVQIPHNILSTLWIENVSRSKAMKERLDLSVAATTSNEDILALRNELHNFVTSPENRRDFKPDFDIQLISVGNMTALDLRVEIRHKSNFSNELLRQTRRNKFMCELLAAMRRIPIDPPGGSSPPLGDPANPSYSVAVSDQIAAASRSKHDEEVESSRLFPKTKGSSFIPEALSTALQNPAAAMMAGITGRRNGYDHVVEGVRHSNDSMRISRELGRSSSGRGQVYYAATGQR